MRNEKKEFTHFKIHTQYSICEGAIKITDLGKYCKENKIQSIGLSDSFNLCGALEFSEEISKSGTQPIIGTQINFIFNKVIGKIPIFAQTKKGFSNLTKLSSKSYLDAKETLPPHCNLDELFSHSEDIIVTSGGLDSLLNSLIKKNNTKEVQEFISKMIKIFSDRFYFEIQRHNDPGEKYLENNLLSLSKKFKVPLIASQEIFYINKDMFEAHDALLCIGQKTYVDEKNRKKFSDQHFMKNSDELENLYKDIPEAIENNYNFPFRFSYKLKKLQPNLPSIKISSNLSENDELLSLSKIGLKNRLENFILKKKNTYDKAQIEKIYYERLNHEIEIINKMNYSGYFLIVSDYIKWAKKIIFL